VFQYKTGVIGAQKQHEFVYSFEQVDTLLTCVKQLILISGENQTFINVLTDVHRLVRKLHHRQYEKHKSKAQYNDGLDKFYRQELWHLGLVVLKHKHAAKAWSVRLDLITKLHKVKRFLEDPLVKTSHSGTEELDSLVKSGSVSHQEKDVGFFHELIKQELSFCDRINKYYPRSYYMWTFRQRLATDLLVPLTTKHLFFGERLLLDEVKSMRVYIKQNPTDASAKHYLQ